MADKLDIVFRFLSQPLVKARRYYRSEDRNLFTSTLKFGLALIYMVLLTPVLMPLACVYFLRNVDHVEQAYGFITKPVRWLWWFLMAHPFYSALTAFVFPLGLMIVYIILFSWAFIPLMTIYYMRREKYEEILDRSFNYLPVTVVFSLVILGSIYFLYSSAKTELAPQEDQGIVISLMTPPPNATLEQRLIYSREAYKLFANYPETDHVFQIDMPGRSIGGIVLKPWDERSRSATDLQTLFQKDLASLTAVNGVAIQPASLPGSRGLPIQFVVKTTENFERLLSVSEDFLKAARALGIFMFIDTDLKIDLPQATVQIDRDKAASLGLNMNDIGSALSAMLGGGYVNYFNLSGRSYKVIPQIEQKSRLNIEQLSNYYIRTADGSSIPLSTIATITTKAVPQTLNHFQQMNASTLSGVMFPGIGLGDALSKLEELAKTQLPEGYSVDYGGQSRQFVQEKSGFVTTFLFALIIIFLVLSAQFESFRDPITILISVPMAVAGALLFISLGLNGASLNIYTQVGLVTLMGLISKHGILIAEFANKLMLEGLSKREAIVKASGLRLRPILMTTSATVLGVAPLIMASGAGAVSRYNMGLVIAAGLSIGTLFTLFVHPAVVLMVGEDHSKHHAPEAQTVIRNEHAAPTTEQST
ncbi:MAG: hypothetical protein EOM37_07740 [Proteobacteria bacterium]|nr:hypothetical protein [Pseudomonadota bacterium]